MMPIGSDTNSSHTIHSKCPKHLLTVCVTCSHLQPVGVAKQAQQAQQGSYLQRHTSSVVLKIAQEASVPSLPAVATMVSPAQ